VNNPQCVHLPAALNIAAARIKAKPNTSLGVLVGQLREQRQWLAALSTGDSPITHYQHALVLMPELRGEELDLEVPRALMFAKGWTAVERVVGHDHPSC
jgi:hypothetical protein